MSQTIRKAFQKLIKSGDMPKTRAEFLDSLETGGDTAKYAFIEALDKLDEKSREAIAGTMRGDGEPWGDIADAAYGAEKAPESKIRGKDAKAKPEKIERPGPSSRADQKTLPPTPGAGRLRGPGNKKAAQPAAPAKDKAAPKSKAPGKAQGKAQAPQGPGALDSVTTPVGTFVPAAQFKGFDPPPPPAAPSEPDLGGVTYGQMGLPPADPTGSIDVAYQGEPTFSADTMGYEPPAEPPLPPSLFEMPMQPSANPALAGLLDGGPMPGNFVDDLSPAFGTANAGLQGMGPDGALTMESMPPAGATFLADTDPATLRRLNPMDMSLLSGDRFPGPSAAQPDAAPMMFDPNWEAAFANAQPARPTMDMSRMSESLYPGNPPPPPTPGSFAGVDWAAGLPDATAATPRPSGLGYGGAPGGSQPPGAQPPSPAAPQPAAGPVSRAGQFMKRTWPWLAGASVIGLAASQGGKPQGYQDDTSDEALARQRERVMQAEQALRAMSSGSGM